MQRFLGKVTDLITRRDVLRLAGVGGVVFASGLARISPASSLPGPSSHGEPSQSPTEDFYFIQLSDCHWGYEGAANPRAAVTLPTTIETINGLTQKPDFIVFTGDLTHNTDDPFERRRRMREFERLVSKSNVKKLYLMPGEHDAALDFGSVYQSLFGATHYTFDHRGIHFIVLDNVSDPRGLLGEQQLGWLKQHLVRLDPATRIVVFTHRPLFDLYPDWEWSTRDGATVIEMLQTFPSVTVFYGHIHQEHHFMTGHIAHHSAKSLVFPLPSPGSKPKPAPVPWDPAHPYQGLGFRAIEAEAQPPAYKTTEHALV